MKAAVIYGARDVRFEERDSPRIVKPTDAVIRTSATCICGSDLWSYRGINKSSAGTLRRAARSHGGVTNLIWKFRRDASYSYERSRMHPGSVRSRTVGAHCRPAISAAWLVAGLVGSMSAGCGGSEGLASDAATDGGGRGDSGGKNPQLFIGTWQPTSGTETLNCAGQVQTSPVTDNTIWQAGTTSDLLQPPDSSGCPFLANVSGNTAIGVPGQSCSQTMNGTTLTLTVTSYSFTVGASGTTATEAGSGNAVATAPISISCTFTETATYSKAP
jgi:hypothetical protein